VRRDPGRCLRRGADRRGEGGARRRRQRPATALGARLPPPARHLLVAGGAHRAAGADALQPGVSPAQGQGRGYRHSSC
jgi:hypothetical protein